MPENRLTDQRATEVICTCVCGAERIVWPSEDLADVYCDACGRDHEHLEPTA